jgi:hypothetical protein
LTGTHRRFATKPWTDVEEVIAAWKKTGFERAPPVLGSSGWGLFGRNRPAAFLKSILYP